MVRSEGGEATRAKMGVTGSGRAVPTKGERKTNRLSRMDWLTGARWKLGNGRGRCRTRRIPREVARRCQPACWTGNIDPAFILKEQSPEQSIKYQKLDFEFRNSLDDNLWLSPWPLVPIYNLEPTHDLVGKGRRHGRWGTREAASKQPSTRSSRSGTGEEHFQVHLAKQECDTRLRLRRTHRCVACSRKVLSGVRQEWWAKWTSESLDSTGPQANRGSWAVRRTRHTERSG